MKTNKAIIFLFSMLVFSMFASASVLVSDVTIRGYVNDQVTGTITISNTGNATVSNLGATRTGFVNYNFTQITNLAGQSIAPGAQISYQYTIKIPTSEAVNIDRHSIGTVTITGQDTNASYTSVSTSYVEVTPRLAISTVEIEIDEDTEKVSNGENVEIKRGDAITLTLELENKFSRNSGIDFNDVEVQVFNDDLDIDEEDEIDIDSGDEETMSFSFIIDEDADEGTETVEITLSGYDDNGVFHRTNFEFDLDIEVPAREVLIRSLSFSPSIVTCDNYATLNVEIKNTGSRDLEEAMIIVESDDDTLDVTKYVRNIVLDESDTYTAKIRIDIPKNTPFGSYLFNVKTYYDGSTSHETDDNIVNLEVAKCVVSTGTGTTPPTTPSTGTTTTPPAQSNGGSITVNTGGTVTVPTGAVYGQEKSFGFDNTQGIILLVLINLIIVGIIIAVTAAIARKG